MDTNPIRYSDLVRPDNSIEELIGQLDELIKKYDEAKGKIKGAADELAKSTQNLSGATEEQRKQIELVTKESDRLATNYAKYNKEERDSYRQKQSLLQATKEQQRIDKLLVELNNAKEGSYKRLSAQYRLNKIRLNEMSAEERKATQSGRNLETETRKIYEEMSRLQKATGKYTLEVGHYENALGGLLGVNRNVVSVLTDSNKAMETFSGAMNFIKTPIAGLIGIIGSLVGVFKLFKDSIHETNTTGDALDNAVAGWSATWEVFRKSVSAMDFTGFIRGAIEAARAGRELQAVLDETFERTASARLLRASMADENAVLEETLRNTKLSYRERREAGEQYLRNMESVYKQEEETARRNRDAQLEYLFSVTNRQKFATEEARKAAKEEFAANIQNYNLNEDLLKQGMAYNRLLDERANLGKGSQSTDRQYWEYVQNRGKELDDIISKTDEQVKQFANFARQYGLAKDEEVQAYVDAEVNYASARNAAYNDQKRIVTLINNLSKQETTELNKDSKNRAAAFEADRLAELRAAVEAIDLEISVTTAGTDRMLELRQAKIEAQRQVELEQNRQRAETARKDEALINAKYDKMLLADKQKFYDEVNKVRIASLQREEQSMQLDLQTTPEGSEEMLQRRLALIDKQREIAIAKNNALTVEMREDEVKINAKYDAMILKTTADFYIKREQVAFNAMQEATANEFSMLNANERQKTLFRLDQERERLAKVLELNALATEQMTAEEVAAIKTRMEAITKEMQTAGFSNLYEVFGLNITGEQQSALNTAFSSIKDSLSSLADSWRAAADAAVESANKQVESAQRALDAEIEAREQGYANSAEMAQKELSLAQQQQTKALAEQKKAQRAQAAIDSLTQASSLITASANIWKSLSGIPYVGYALAIAAIASMWGSFAAAKVKASQVSKETYGEGTVELLEGGSHASGHDIDLGTKPDGTKRRAEGGEYFAVINKRNSRRFRRQIPDVINALNDGTFAEKYVRAGEKISTFAVQGGTDISGLSKDVHAIREQGDTERYLDGNGAVVIRYKNLTRKIKS